MIRMIQMIHHYQKFLTFRKWLRNQMFRSNLKFQMFQIVLTIQK